TGYYVMGRWADEESLHKRQSENDQRDEDGDVKTDTLVMRRPARTAQVRLTLLPGKNGSLPKMKLLTFSFAGEPPQTQSTEPNSKPPPMAPLEVPEKSQMAYEGGGDWCS